MARRFFADPETVSEITGVSKDLIQRFRIILEAITCNEAIDPKKFGEYAQQTANLFVSEYMWYNMPSTVHKILVHGQKIIENAIFPIGALSEEAQECRNKDYKRYRSMHSRRFSRIATNEDIIHMMLLSSDPYLSKLRPQPKKKSLPLSEETKTLLMSQ